MKIINIKPVINKRNKQINFSLPKRKLSKRVLREILSGRKIKFKLGEL